MEITTRDFFTVLHGMGFGALFMLAFSGALVELYRISAPGAQSPMSARGQQVLGFYLMAMQSNQPWLGCSVPYVAQEKAKLTCFPIGCSAAGAL